MQKKKMNYVDYYIGQKKGNFQRALRSPGTNQRQSFLEEQDRKREKLRSQGKRKIEK